MQYLTNADRRLLRELMIRVHRSPNVLQWVPRGVSGYDDGRFDGDERVRDLWLGCDRLDDDAALLLSEASVLGWLTDGINDDPDNDDGGVIHVSLTDRGRAYIEDFLNQRSV